MNELLKALYDNFYDKLPTTQLKQSHRELIEKLNKPKRRLVLQIVDFKEQIAEDLSIDSFIAAFPRAWKPSQELNM